MKSIKERLESKDKNVIERIYMKYSKDLFYFAYSLCNNQDLAQDIVDQAFERWIYKAPNIDDDDMIFHYLLKIERNLIYDYNKERKHYYFFRTDEEYDSAMENIADPDSLKEKEDGSFIEFLQSVLSVEDYMLLYYHDVYEYDFKRIAEIYCLTPRQVRYRYKKIVAKVRKLYAERMGNGNPYYKQIIEKENSK